MLEDYTILGMANVPSEEPLMTASCMDLEDADYELEHS